VDSQCNLITINHNLKLDLHPVDPLICLRITKSREIGDPKMSPKAESTSASNVTAHILVIPLFILISRPSIHHLG
jgi:hypothetical protein